METLSVGQLQNETMINKIHQDSSIENSIELWLEAFKSQYFSQIYFYN
jgi:hypothetical protein